MSWPISFKRFAVAIFLLASPVSSTAALAQMWSYAPRNPLSWFNSYMSNLNVQIASLQSAYSVPEALVVELPPVAHAVERNWFDMHIGRFRSYVRRHIYGLNDWLHNDVTQAWQQGYMGQGVQVSVVDNFKIYPGERDAHGDLVRRTLRAVTPSAIIQHYSYTSDTDRFTLSELHSTSLNIINASWGDSPGNIAPESSEIVTAAHEGLAVVVKAAGNDGHAADLGPEWYTREPYTEYAGSVPEFWNDNPDVFLHKLIGAESVIFAGSLEANGQASTGVCRLASYWFCVDRRARIAPYSNHAGENPDVQEHFLMVGVDEDAMGLAGTSFAAPIISGYAAILGSKFPTATPMQIVNQLLDTARTDTILDYDVAIHGQGEASLSRAMAPSFIR